MAAWSDEPLAEREFPDETDLAEEGHAAGAIVPCPACGVGIHDQAQQCPHCKTWITHRLEDWRNSGKWYVRGGLWLAKTLLWNWLFWIGLGVLGILAWVITAVTR